MQKTPVKLTFFTQSLQRTGSEIVLFNLLQHISGAWEKRLVSYYQGELDNKLQEGIPREILYRVKPTQRMASRIIHLLERNIAVPRKLRRLHDSVWYVNTIVLPDLIEYAEKHHIEVILHVHELEQMYRLLSKVQIERLIEYPSWIIANSETSAAVLHKLGRVSRISVCYPGIDTTHIQRDSTSYTKCRTELGIDSGKFVWLMCGTLDKNKNPFLFLEAAALLASQQKDARFLWLGGTSDKAFEQECKKRTSSLGLSNLVYWLGNKGTAYSYFFNSADGFLLTSERESFSLVTLEALLLGLPVVSTDCGGVKEVLGNDIGKVIAGTSSAQELANAMLSYMDKILVFDALKERKRGEMFDIIPVSQHWNRILEQILIHSHP